jgi:hypothetical protein
MKLSVDLPMPPSANNMFATYNGRRIISRDYKAWKTEAGASLLKQWEVADKPVITKPYAVHIRLNLNYQSDCANREKALTDLLVATIPGFPDDRWADLVVIERDRKVSAASVDVVSL